MLSYQPIYKYRELNGCCTVKKTVCRWAFFSPRKSRNYEYLRAISSWGQFVRKISKIREAVHQICKTIGGIFCAIFYLQRDCRANLVEQGRTQKYGNHNTFDNMLLYIYIFFKLKYIFSSLSILTDFFKIFGLKKS